jgi:hypothetical protein
LQTLKKKKKNNKKVLKNLMKNKNIWIIVKEK